MTYAIFLFRAKAPKTGRGEDRRPAQVLAGKWQGEDGFVVDGPRPSTSLRKALRFPTESQAEHFRSKLLGPSRRLYEDDRERLWRPVVAPVGEDELFGKRKRAKPQYRQEVMFP